MIQGNNQKFFLNLHKVMCILDYLSQSETKTTDPPLTQNTLNKYFTIIGIQIGTTYAKY